MTDEWLRKATRPVRIARVDATAPNVARVWNYLVGGPDNFEADRTAVREAMALAPVVADVAPASRAFLRRVVRFLAAEAGIRQFLDIGSGIPTAGGTHELAQAVDPASRIVYVDNDPVVSAHARALVLSRPEGVVSYLQADAREPAAIIDAARLTLDLGQPAAIVMIGILNFIQGPGLVAAVLRTLVAALSPGSYLAIAQPARPNGGSPPSGGGTSTPRCGSGCATARRWPPGSPACPWWRRASSRSTSGVLIRATRRTPMGSRSTGRSAENRKRNLSPQSCATCDP